MQNKLSILLVLSLSTNAFALRQMPYSYRHAPLFGGSVVYDSADFGEVSSESSYDSVLSSELYDEETDDTFDYSELTYVPPRVFKLRKYDTMPNDREQNFRTSVANAWANAFIESRERQFNSKVVLKDRGIVEKISRLFKCCA